MARHSPLNINLISESSNIRHEDDDHESASTLRERTSPSVYLDIDSVEYDSLSSTILKKGWKFKIPNLGKYKGTTDPQDHFANCRATMCLQEAIEEVM